MFPPEDTQHMGLKDNQDGPAQAGSAPETGQRPGEFVEAVVRAAGPQADGRRLAEHFLEQLRTFLGCEWAAIRLQEAGDYPFFVCVGFPVESIKKDSRLAVYDEAERRPVRQTSGEFLLDCLCGDVIRGKIDPALPFSTSNGSFWTVDLAHLLERTSVPPRLSRGHCRSIGLRSLILTPLRSETETVGLLLLGSPRRNVFTAEVVHTVENIASAFMPFLCHRLCDESRRGTMPCLEALSQETTEAWAYVRVLCGHEGAPIDWLFIQANELFARLWNTSEVAGRTARELLPEALETYPTDLSTTTRVLASGNPVRDTTFVAYLNRWMETVVCSPYEDHLLILMRDVSREKEALEQADLMRTTFDQIDDYALWFDRGWRIVAVSEAACRHLEYSREELLEMTVFDLDPQAEWLMPKVTDKEYEDRWADFKARSPFVVEVVHRTKSGRLLTVEASNSIVTIGSKEYVCAFCRDISARRHLEQSLYLAQISLERSPDLIHWLDMEGRIIYANEASCALLGYTPQEFLQMHVWDLDPHMSPELHAERVEQGRKQGRQSYEGFLRAKDGRLLTVEVNSQHVAFGDKEIAVVTMRDVTERKQVEEELERSQQMLRLVIDSVPLKINWKDRDLRVVGYNKAMADEWGVPDTEAAIGLTTEEILEHYKELSPHPHKRRDDVEVLRSGEAKLSYEEKVESPKGTRLFRSSKIPLKNRQGEVVGLLSVHEDITQYRRAVESLRAREEQLRQLQKMEALGRLAGGVAHDFNNALTTIIGYCDLILSSTQCPGGSFREDVGEIRAAAERATALTRQILAFSRRQALRPELLSVNQVIADTEKLLARTIGADIELRTVLDPSVGMVRVDEQQFTQVLLNLAVNARDAMPQGGRLTISTYNVELSQAFSDTHPDVVPGPYVLITVSDTGVGMDNDTLEHAFEPFFTTKPKGEGTGLGLATVYGVITQSGGHIYVRSSPGQGTTFDIYLPRVEMAEPEDRLPAAAEDVPRPSGPSASIGEWRYPREAVHDRERFAADQS